MLNPSLSCIHLTLQIPKNIKKEKKKKNNKVIILEHNSDTRDFYVKLRSEKVEEKKERDTHFNI